MKSVHVLYCANNQCLWVRWYRYFYEVNDWMFYSTRRSQVEYKFHLSSNENVCTIAIIKIHSLFYQKYFCRIERLIDFYILGNAILFQSRRLRSKVMHAIPYHCTVHMRSMVYLFYTTWSFIIQSNDLFCWLVVFYVPSTARSFRDGTTIYCPLRSTWSSVNTPFPPEIEPRTVAWQSITLPLRHASSTTNQMKIIYIGII